MKLSEYICELALSVFCSSIVRGVGSIRLIEEKSGDNHRYVTMTELEEKSSLYLKRYKRVRDENEIKQKASRIIS
ncbi:Hypothetical protein NTJ_10630 [Nesidiocoris tenuis]|uniref:Uncharacterized protein n=1 Tax=Nesidiocoris tenuis TaxID=355587 RepID=A0ABN7B3Q5_9HEMI|nr:Hypothetical protein NTJ_10630 [Nesidiocoris tenuis]